MSMLTVRLSHWRSLLTKIDISSLLFSEEPRSADLGEALQGEMYSTEQTALSAGAGCGKTAGQIIKCPEGGRSAADDFAGEQPLRC